MEKIIFASLFVALFVVIMAVAFIKLVKRRDLETQKQERDERDKVRSNTYKEIIAQLKIEIEKQRMHIRDLELSLEDEKNKACIDSLTGIYNRRYLDENSKEGVELIESLGKPVSFLFIDLDEFKEINDTFGHKTGDEILRKVAKKIETVARRTDVYLRLGGDEFFMILPGTKIEQAIKVSKRLEKEICKIPQDLGIYSPRFGVSIGAVEHVPGRTVEEVLSLSDEMMYLAKKRRKNK